MSEQSSPFFRFRLVLVVWILLTSSEGFDQWGSTGTALAAAFSLASIFPRKIDRVTTKTEADHRHELQTYTGQFNDIKSKILTPDGTVEVESRKPNSWAFDDNKVQREEGSRVRRSRSSSSDSVHLQIQAVTATRRIRTETVEQSVGRVSDVITANDNTDAGADEPRATRVRVQSYIDPKDNRLWVALNTSVRKFLAFLEYNQVTTASRGAISTSTVTLPDQNNPDGAQGIAPTKVNGSIETEVDIRKKWKELWEARQLLTDRTELLSVYQSDKPKTTSKSNNLQANRNKRGGFRDLLNLYHNRLLAILKDEQQDERTPPDARHRSALVRPQQRNIYGQHVKDEEISLRSDHRILIKWLEDHYGVSETLLLHRSRLRSFPQAAQLELMKQFLDWFRENFPYYYDQCDDCGASQKDDLAAQPQDDVATMNNFRDIDLDDDDDGATFIGYIYPSELELLGKASRTELYQCHKCGHFTRFPRYNSAFDIVKSRRGRCGEYSLLLYRFLRALNHEARWVVDWADHVWAEVLIGECNGSNVKRHRGGVAGAKAGTNATANGKAERWVHLDPCEAAVDNPLLYEGWGKKQTYIMALYAPLRYPAIQVQNRNNFFLGQNHIMAAANSFTKMIARDHSKAKLVEDVTQEYTTDSWEDICSRRDESDEEVNVAIKDAIDDLEKELLL